MNILIVHLMIFIVFVRFDTSTASNRKAIDDDSFAKKKTKSKYKNIMQGYFQIKQGN